MDAAPVVFVPEVVSASNNSWNDGIFCCLTQIYPSCMISCICPFLMSFNIYRKLFNGTPLKSLLTLRSVVVFVFVAWVFAISILTNPLLLVLYSWLFFAYIVWRQRLKTQSYFNIISSSDCGEAILSLFCTSCVLAQIARHIYNYRGSMYCDDYSCTCDGTPRWQLNPELLHNNTQDNLEDSTNTTVVIIQIDPITATDRITNDDGPVINLDNLESSNSSHICGRDGTSISPQEPSSFPPVVVVQAYPFVESHTRPSIFT